MQIIYKNIRWYLSKFTYYLYSFYRKRTPMIIIIFGAPCMGKSILANNLAERLNISNVL